MGVEQVRLAAMVIIACMMVASACSVAPTHLEPARARAYDGGQVQFDGMYYDFRAANGIQQTKMWVPPGPEPIRGVFFHGNPGGYGDTRNQPREERFQEFAARYRFAIMGVTSFPGGQVYPKLAEMIVKSMNDWAAMGFHPEIANIPIIARGSSNAGFTAYSLAGYLPERMICFTPNVGARYNPYPPSDALMRVPALMHIGPNDPFFRNGMQTTADLFAFARPKGARWAWDAEKGKGHEIAHIDDEDMKYYEEAIALRLPKDVDARKGPVSLVDLPEESGWLADPTSWESGITYIASYKDYDRDRSKAVWFPTADLAYLYRGVATYDNPLKLIIRQIPRIENPNESGTLLQTAAGPVVEPGMHILLECDASAMPDWQTITFYHGAKEIGRVENGRPAQITFAVEPQYTVYALTAVGRTADGTERAATPVHFMVTDPQISKAIAAQWASHDVLAPKPPRPAPGSSAGGGAPKAPEAGENVLVAYGLSVEQEQTFAPEGKLSAFWDAVGAQPGQVVMTPESSLVAQQQGQGGQAAGAPGSLSVTVRAAHSRAGLYMLFVVDDAEWAPAEGLDDAVDFHLARTSSKEIWAANPADIFAKPESWGFVLSEMQYQICMGNDQKPATTISRNFCDPWDVPSVSDGYAAAAQKYGIIVKHVTLAPTRKALELFIPWQYVGNGGNMDEPAAGKMLGLALGYNDRDPSRQPAAGQTDNLRWPNKTDVWAIAGQRGPNPTPPPRDIFFAAPKGPNQSPWADLLIGPMLAK